MLKCPDNQSRVIDSFIYMIVCGLVMLIVPKLFDKYCYAFSKNTLLLSKKKHTIHMCYEKSGSSIRIMKNMQSDFKEMVAFAQTNHITTLYCFTHAIIIKGFVHSLYYKTDKDVCDDGIDKLLNEAKEGKKEVIIESSIESLKITYVGDKFNVLNFANENFSFKEALKKVPYYKVEYTLPSNVDILT